MTGNSLFSEIAIRAFEFAEQEAKAFNHEYIGTEHLLIGLTRVSDSLAVAMLHEFGISADRVCLELHRLMMRGPEIVMRSKLPQTPRTKNAIEYALQEAQAFKHRRVGTEHLLLGLLRENECVACQVLLYFGLTFDKARLYVQTHCGNL